MVAATTIATCASIARRMVSGWPSSSAQCLPTTAHPARHKTVIWVALAVVAALILRLLVLASPLGDLDADEAVVGLMGRHIAYAGELPVFYYGQPYLGSLEAFSAAGVFLLIGS